MSKSFKIIFLGLLIAIPVVLVLFLRYFGENRFDIPIYYQEGISNKLNKDCEYADGPYRVPDSLFNNKGVRIVLFYKEDEGFLHSDLVNEVTRLQEIFDKQLANIIVYSPSPVEIAGVDNRRFSQEKSDDLMKCIYITSEVNQYILIDKINQIRGYYETDLDEVDRLIVEIKILLENGGS